MSRYTLVLRACSAEGQPHVAQFLGKAFSLKETTCATIAQSMPIALLDDLSRQFGYYRNELLNIVMTGLEGKVNMARMLGTMRQSPPKSIGGLPVASVEDLQDESGRMGPFKGDTDKAARNFLIFRLGGTGGMSAKVCLRPSGTEPKAKAYMEVASEPRKANMPQAEWNATCAAVDAQVQKIATDFLTLAMTTVGQTPPPGADKLSR